MEIDRLRQEARAQPKYAVENRVLQDQVLRLTVELHAMKRILASHGPEPGGMPGAAPGID